MLLTIRAAVDLQPYNRVVIKSSRSTNSTYDGVENINIKCANGCDTLFGRDSHGAACKYGCTMPNPLSFHGHVRLPFAYICCYLQAAPLVYAHHLMFNSNDRPASRSFYIESGDVFVYLLTQFVLLFQLDYYFGSSNATLNDTQSYIDLIYDREYQDFLQWMANDRKSVAIRLERERENLLRSRYAVIDM